MSAETTAKIRDRRKAGWFRVDDEIIEVYGPDIGCHGIAVYAALCKHANKEESSHPGLRLLCKKLKIGRKKLLDTLAKLKKVGLIDIEPGDRASVSVYTLLDVPKRGSNENQGGSNENQEVVPTRTRGGSEQHQGGGSNENRNQTHREPDPVNQSSRAEDEPLPVEQLPDDTTAKCLLLLSRVKGFPRSNADTALYLAELRVEFPAADASEICRQYQVWHRDNPGKTRNFRGRLRNFFERSAKSTNNVSHLNGKPPPSNAPAADEEHKRRVRAAMGMD